MKSLLYIWLPALFFACPVQAQRLVDNTRLAASGLRLYSARDYKAHSQNFAVTANSQGVLYFGNFAGVLEYDGVFWKTIPTAKISKVSALHADRSDRILVGGKDEFGYLAKDRTGKLVFRSVSGQLSGFGAINTILETTEGTYFVASRQVFLWNGKRLRKWDCPRPITAAFNVHGNVYLFRQGAGLCTFNDGIYSPVFPADGPQGLPDVTSLFPAGEETVVLTGSKGIFRLEGSRLTRFSEEANRIVANKELYGARMLADGTMALMVEDGQIVFVYPQSGAVARVISENYRLMDERVNAWIQDKAGNIWLAMNNGIAQLDIASPITEYDEDNNLRGQINDVIRFDGRIYCGTSNGLYVLDGEIFNPVKAVRLAVWSMTVHNGALYAATSKGVFRIDKSVSQFSSEFALAVCASGVKPDVLYAGLENGLEILDLRSRNTRRVKGITGQIERIIEDPRGNAWLETPAAGVVRLAADGITVKHYTQAQGLPTPLLNHIVQTSDGILASNPDGIFRYNAATDRFEAYKNLAGNDTASVWRGELVADAAGNIWTTNGDSRFITWFEKAGAGKFRQVIKPFLPLSDRDINVIYPDAGQLMWFGGSDGLIRYDLKLRKDDARAFPAFIRRVAAKGDTVLADGFIGSANADSIAAGTSDPVRLAYQFNDMSFEFSAASMLPQDNLEYQVYLENFDKTWSSWSTKNQKEYTNIPPGDYRFRVKARNIYYNQSSEASFAFTVIPPLYQRWWAYVLYALLIPAGIFFLNKQRRSFLLKRTRNLENLIHERTEEVVSQKEELEQQSEQLSATNDQLERIDDFVKAINSEVNTRKLFQLVLERLCLFQNVDSASALIHNRATGNYQFIAITGGIDIDELEGVTMSYDQAEQRYMENGTEIFEDIFLKNNFRSENLNSTINDAYAPKSLITIIIRVEGEAKSFITLENTDHENAFVERDFIMVRNLKEHLIAAYIKTDILENLENTLTNLKSAQEELIRQERLASVGSLTKGIVDRILNPLNYINNFSQSSGKLLTEITEVTDKHTEALSEDEKDDLESGLDMLRKNLEKIYEHGNSTTRIVKDMQKLLKGKSTEFFTTELSPFLESKARSAFQEIVTEYKGNAVDLTFSLAPTGVKVSLLPFEFAQVLTNLISNSCYALIEKARIDPTFEPRLHVSSALVEGGICIRIRDNGKGIPPKEVEQLFNPFFTTKPTSKGTGLGLYMSKDIIEYHKGRISMHSEEGEFTEVEIVLPVVAESAKIAI